MADTAAAPAPEAQGTVTPQPSKLVLRVVGASLVIGIIVLLYLLGSLWPNRQPPRPPSTQATIDPAAYFPGFKVVYVPDELR